MPIFMVERNFAEELEPSVEVADGINRINDQAGVRWIYSFLSADERAGLPADVIAEVSDRVMSDG